MFLRSVTRLLKFYSLVQRLPPVTALGQHVQPHSPNHRFPGFFQDHRFLRFLRFFCFPFFLVVYGFRRFSLPLQLFQLLIIQLITLNFQLQQSEIVYPHAVALAQMLTNNPRQLNQHRHDRAARSSCASANLPNHLPRLHRPLVHRHSLPPPEVLQRRSVLFHHSILHLPFSFLKYYVTVNYVSMLLCLKPPLLCLKSPVTLSKPQLPCLKHCFTLRFCREFYCKVMLYDWHVKICRLHVQVNGC